jgi:hypothetical protein
MSLFIEVNSIEKGCPVMINLDEVLEIAPLMEGGCALFFADAAAVNGKNAMKVSDSYALFKQLAMQMVTPEDISKRFPKAKPEKLEVVQPVVQPTKVFKGKGDLDGFDIPKL